MEERTAFRTCPFCEATCGLAVTVRGDEVVQGPRRRRRRVLARLPVPEGRGAQGPPRGPRPAAHAARARRGRRAAARRAGTRRSRAIGARLAAVRDAHGPDAVGVYIGNPAAHGLAALLYGRVLLKALGTRSVFSASTVDQRPKEIASALMFGAPLSVPIPDVDRTHAPADAGRQPARLERLADDRARHARAAEGAAGARRQARRRRPAPQPHRRGRRRAPPDPPGHRRAPALRPRARAVRGGPRRTRAAGGRTSTGSTRSATSPGRSRPRPWRRSAGSRAETIRRMARELAAAEAAAVYGRIGTTTQEFGTLASWLVDVLNVLTGNLDRPGGAMFPRAAAGQRNSAGAPGRGRGVTLGRWHSRVRGLPESLGELPVAALAEEMEAPGEGQVRALITLAGNPARSTPNSARMERALDGLDLLRRGRHLRQRDDAPRRRGPARAVAAGAVALRPGALPAGGPQRGELLAARAPAGPGRARRVGHAAAPRRRWRRGSRRPTTSSRSTGSWPAS